MADEGVNWEVVSRGYSYTNGTYTKSVDGSQWEIVSVNAFVETILGLLLTYMILRTLLFFVLIIDATFDWLEPRPNSVGLRRSMDSLPLWFKAWVLLFVLHVASMPVGIRNDPFLTTYEAVFFALFSSTFHTLFWGFAFRHFASKGFSSDKIRQLPFFPKKGKRLRATVQCVFSWIIFEASLFFAEANEWVELIPL
jgi:hypothetical protein